MSIVKAALKWIFWLIRELFLLLFLVPYAVLSRFREKKIDVGLGPDPLINNVYHKKALEEQGYSAETFTLQPYFITNDFDIVLSEKYDLKTAVGLLRALTEYALLPFRYKILYIYFNGGPLGFTKILWRVEPFLYKLAGIKVVVMPYGGDVQEMSRSPNLDFKHSMTRDYPGHRHRRAMIAAKIDLWTRFADHVIGGCEWVDYMYHWDTLMIAHFSIDTALKEGEPQVRTGQVQKQPLKVLHAPNHRVIKGTEHLIKAVDELKAEGLEIELVMLEKVPNEKVIELIQEVDIVADQFVIGWYAMFAIEAMKHAKPVLCYLREDLIDLYTGAGLLEPGEIPLINTRWTQIKERLTELYEARETLHAIGQRSRTYVLKHHSVKYVGEVFAGINKDLIGR